MGLGGLVKVAVSISWDHPPCRSGDISDVGFCTGPQCPNKTHCLLMMVFPKVHLQLGFSREKLWCTCQPIGSAASLMKYYFLNIVLSLCGTKSSSQGPSWCFQMHFYLITWLGLLSYCFLRLDHLIFDLSLIDSLCDHTLLRQIKELRAFGEIPRGVTVRWVWVGMCDSIPLPFLLFWRQVAHSNDLYCLKGSPWGYRIATATPKVNVEFLFPLWVGSSCVKES